MKKDYKKPHSKRSIGVFEGQWLLDQRCAWSHSKNIVIVLSPVPVPDPDLLAFQCNHSKCPFRSCLVIEEVAVIKKYYQEGVLPIQDQKEFLLNIL